MKNCIRYDAVYENLVYIGRKLGAIASDMENVASLHLYGIRR